MVGGWGGLEGVKERYGSSLDSPGPLSEGIGVTTSLLLLYFSGVT